MAGGGAPDGDDVYSQEHRRKSPELLFQSAGTTISTNRFFLLQPHCMRVRMKRALVLFAVLLPLFTPRAFGRVPELNVKAVCKARSADAKVMHSISEQSIADCVRDEEAAKQQLISLWASVPVRMGNRCESDARSLGTTSYLDLLACMQIAEDTKPSPKKADGEAVTAQPRATPTRRSQRQAHP
jgi:hypothetical protein